MPASALFRHEHPQRRRLHDEVHARPYELLQAPVRASHLALRVGEGAGAAGREHLDALCARLGVTPPEEDATYFSQDFGPFRLRWERHTEFYTYTVLRTDPFDDPFAETALELLPGDWLEALPGELLVAAHLGLEARDRAPEEVTALFGGNQVAGSRTQGGAARVWTDFHLHGDGCGRFLVADRGLTRGQAGRLVQRLFEIETYRMMALLAFPLARATGPRLEALDRELSDVVGRFAQVREARNEKSLLERLSVIAAEIEKTAAETSYRFSAARAYHGIVRQRIQELREERVPGVQMIAEFMDRRLTPAMRTCEATLARQDNLARRVERAGALLRTRVDIALEEQNRDLLASMNRRAKLQLRLQETVEGLSVVAISYYGLGLVAYAAKGLKAAGVPVSTEIAVAVMLPVVVATVWAGMRRLRRRLTGKEG